MLFNPRRRGDFSRRLQFDGMALTVRKRQRVALEPLFFGDRQRCCESRPPDKSTTPIVNVLPRRPKELCGVVSENVRSTRPRGSTRRVAQHSVQTLMERTIRQRHGPGGCISHRCPLPSNNHLGHRSQTSPGHSHATRQRWNRDSDVLHRIVSGLHLTVKLTVSSVELSVKSYMNVF